ncbi:hypothetical protein AAY81_09930 [Denitrobacterium detoxificans]|uniref:Uncharacterized protein n=1 Tax=Denitrobacterium detoxificans TaxID=79604 RepID=A0A172S049_9ACTN|nr:hypothetical protein [Denitrobacterium detoxificans]ANE23357.1 hypothetical protein AAY81_09930 [Denitrobacterium detoxificans]SEO41604.1 hypothetical protein SAMN02910314_00183 [Denitrobacterium detoxificans]
MKKLGKSRHAGESIHIKRFTRGTSNELSFSVLDARGDAVAAQEEVARRKKKRVALRGVQWFMAFAAIAVVAILFVSYMRTLAQQDEKMRSSVGEAIGYIQQSDEDIVAMDQLLGQEVNDGTVSQMKELLEKLPSSNSLLDRATNKATEVLNGDDNSGGVEMATRAQESAQARKTLVQAGSELLDAAVSAEEAIDDMNEAWEALKLGHEKSVAAAELVKDTTEENVTASMALSKEAIDYYQQALLSISAASKLVPSANLQAYLNYANTALSAEQEAVESDEAILLQDKSTAENHNDSANTYTNAASRIAETFPSSPSQPIIDAYNQDTQQLWSDYEQARSTAAQADAYLRDYLRNA